MYGYKANIIKEVIPKRFKPDLFKDRKVKLSRNDKKLFKILSNQSQCSNIDLNVPQQNNPKVLLRKSTGSKRNSRPHTKLVSELDRKYKSSLSRFKRKYGIK